MGSRVTMQAGLGVYRGDRECEKRMTQCWKAPEHLLPQLFWGLSPTPVQAMAAGRGHKGM